MTRFYAAFSAIFLTWLAWEFLLRAHLVSPAALAYPSEVIKAAPAFMFRGANARDLTSTLYKTLVAFIASVPIGLGTGVLLFYFRPLQQPGKFAIDFLRSIPATALVPVFLILYGVGDATKIAVGTFSSALVLSVATLTGLERRNATRVLVASLSGVRGVRRIILVDLPEAAPQLFLGLRTGVSLALILVVVSEMLIGANRGLGRVIADMQYTDDKGRMYAAIIATGVLGYTLNLALRYVEKSELWWSNN